MDLSGNAWDNRYLNNYIGWDLGQVSSPLKAYFDQLENKEIKILIPGGGNSYEAEYLFNSGFNNTYVLDISKIALENIKNRVPKFPSSQLIHANFFDLNMTFDLVIEQTFFCAIDPNLRANYAVKIKNLLNEKGKLVGVLFDAKLNKDYPPFGGNIKEYTTYFEPYFRMDVFTKCYNSFHNRKEMELFMKFVKK
jgi:SAM-dependent methyltransferase